MDIYVVYNDDSQLERIKQAKLKSNIFFNFADERTRSGLKESWKIKGPLAAKLSPFAAIYEEDKPIKAFYSEADDDVIQSLIDYLK